MNRLNKHSAQLEEVWLGRSHLYIYIHGSHIIYRLKNKGVSLHFPWEDYKWVPAAFFKRLCETGRSSNTESRFQSYLYSMCASPLKPATWLQHEKKRWTAPNRCSAPVVQASSLMGSLQTPLLPSLPFPEEDISH